MKRQIKIFSVALSLLLGSGGLYAQHDHEFSLNGGGGLSTLKYKTTVGERKAGPGGHFGLGYHYFFAPNWGLGTGLELAFYNARFKMDHLNVRYMALDIEATAFEFRSTVSDYKEKQHAMTLQIPAMLQFQTNKADKNLQFFAAAGGKVGIPVTEKYKTTVSLSNSGYYAHENSLYDTQEFVGFGAFPDRKVKDGLCFKTALFLSGEAGVKWKMNEKRSLYIGVYADYGLNNVAKSHHPAIRSSLVTYNRDEASGFAVNSIVNSQHTRNSSAPQAFTEKIKPLAVGIKLRLAFGKNNCRQVEAYPETPVAPAPNNATESNRRNSYAEQARQEAYARRQAEAAALNAAKRVIEQPIDHFDLSEMELDDFQKRILDEKIELLQQYPNLRFIIYGHTCDAGSEEVNMRAGLARATVVKDYLISKGIAENRILSISSKGKSEPVLPNTSEDNRQRNRRVQLLIP